MSKGELLLEQMTKLVEERGGRIAYKTGNHDLAINLLRESIQDQPDRPEVLYPLAYATYRIGQIEQAFSIMQRALETELEEPRRLEMSAFLRMLELHQPAPHGPRCHCGCRRRARIRGSRL